MQRARVGSRELHRCVIIRGRLSELQASGWKRIDLKRAQHSRVHERGSKRDSPLLLLASALSGVRVPLGSLRCLSLQARACAASNEAESRQRKEGGQRLNWATRIGAEGNVADAPWERAIRLQSSTA